MYSVSTFKSQERSTFLKFCLLLCLLTISAATAEAAAYTVTNTNDGGAGSLRQAIIDADNNPGADTIDFDTAGVFATRQTITLTSGQLSISGILTLNGPGANL